MSFTYHDQLRCPLDQLPLLQQDKTLMCANGHSYDVARRGYVNLLGARDKRSRDPGDSKEMVAARGKFLNAGHYQPIANKLAELVQPLNACGRVIVDAGCGEGYYLKHLHTQLQSNSPLHAHLIGYDISKWAVQTAAPKMPATWLVASNRRIPLAPGSVDCLLNLFGFPVFESFWKVMKEDSVLISVDAGQNHLIELREVLYPNITYSEPRRIAQALSAGFSVGQEETLQFKTTPLSQLEINQLLSMTPHLFRASRAGRKRSALLDQMPVTVDVVFQRFSKRTATT